MTTCFDVCRLKNQTLNVYQKKDIMYFENLRLVIWIFLINERPTRYTRHTGYTHKHLRTPYAHMSAQRDQHILDSFVILVDYFAVFVKI